MLPTSSATYKVGSFENLQVTIPSFTRYTPVDTLAEGEMSTVLLVRNTIGYLFAAKRYRSESMLLEGDYPTGYIESLYDEEGNCKLAQTELSISEELHQREDSPPLKHLVKALGVSYQTNRDGARETYLFREYVAGTRFEDINEISYSNALKNITQLLDTLIKIVVSGNIYTNIFTNDLILDASGDIMLMDLSNIRKINDVAPLSTDEYLGSVSSVIESMLHKSRISIDLIEKHMEDIQSIVSLVEKAVLEGPITMDNRMSDLLPILQQIFGYISFELSPDLLLTSALRV